MSDITVSSDVDSMLQSADNAAILTNVGAAPTASPTFTANGLNPIQFGTVGPPYVTDGQTRFTDGIRVDSSSIEGFLTGTAGGGAVTGQDLNIRGGATAGDGSTAGDLVLSGGQAMRIAGQTTTNGKVKIGEANTNGVELYGVTEIQCLGTTTGTAQPINYDAKEHRFRDYDESPTDLMVIRKIDGSTGARIGINRDTADSTLHIVAGNTGGVQDTALKVVGGAFFENYVRIGHYATVDLPSSPNNGTVVYNTTLNKFQGFLGGSGWKSFQMEA
tara:strand:- start:4673 stop:5494 length:822 start_codon:yes stop_codon:yes gene_type:complete